MRRSPLDFTATTPQAFPSCQSETVYTPISERAQAAAAFIVGHLDLPRLAQVSFEVQELPLVHERARPYVPFLSDNPDDGPLLYQPVLGEEHHYLKKPAIRLGLKGSTYSFAYTPDNFYVLYETFRLQDGQMVMKCSPSVPPTPRTTDTAIAREQAIAELFPGQDARKVANLASINAAYIDGAKRIYALQTFNMQAFGCDILRILSYGIHTTNGKRLSIDITNTSITEHSTT